MKEASDNSGARMVINPYPVQVPGFSAREQLRSIVEEY